MVWLLLRSAYMTQQFCIHPESEWLARDRHWRFGWDIVRRCESRHEATRLLAELQAAAASRAQRH